MTPLHPIYTLLVFLVGFLVVWIISFRYPQNSRKNRYETLDGLRGFLAISVFIHHTAVWHGYLQTGNWVEPDSNLFNQLGQSGVAFFFMISSFLFVSKLLNFRGEDYPWKEFFIGRIFRIVPLYILSLLLIMLVVGTLSEWTLRVSSFDFLKNLIRWSGLGILGQPDLNGIDYTATINSFVNWSLLYEWLLYFSLPIISILILKKKPNIQYLFFGMLFFVFAVIYRDVKLEHLLSLFGGAVSAFIYKYSYRKINFNTLLFTLLTIGALLIVVQFRTSEHLICKIFLVIAFTLIALGNDLFGLLKSNTLKLMGKISYSTYLLHGILIFVLFNFVSDKNAIRSLSNAEYCGLVIGMTPVLMLVSLLSYHYLERPFILKYKKRNRTPVDKLKYNFRPINQSPPK